MAVFKHSFNTFPFTSEVSVLTNIGHLIFDLIDALTLLILVYIYVYIFVNNWITADKYN